MKSAKIVHRTFLVHTTNVRNKQLQLLEIRAATYRLSPLQLTAIPTLVPDGFIYLRAKPDTCFNRLKKRGRSEETGVDMDYLMVRTLTRSSSPTPFDVLVC